MLGANYEMDPKEMNAFKLVQKEAANEGKVFFMETGNGHEIITDDLILEEMWGWLIPEEMVFVFDKIYQDEEGYSWLNSDESPWWDYFYYIEWEKTEDGFRNKFIYCTNILDVEMYGI